MSGSPPHGSGNPFSDAGHTSPVSSRHVLKQPLKSDCSFRTFGETQAGSPFGQWQKHREYYFEDGNVVFLVENVLYNLHRSMLEKHSTVFQEMWSIPPPAGNTEGSQAYNPIVLAGIKAIDFTRLLWIIYPPVLGSCKATTVDEWVSILDQADRWQIDNLRFFAIKTLQSMSVDPVLKIMLWTRHNLDRSELISSYASLVTRPQSLSIDEAKRLGVETTAKVAQARDAIHREGICDCCHLRKAWKRSKLATPEETELFVMRMAEDILK
ncbi:hypothetical protein B0H21DRAFT_684629 [Amylocystis lapponica]|nr:hypothetical protein B0H21DRAFT_684629 [Amylocystis lapponica]